MQQPETSEAGHMQFDENEKINLAQFRSLLDSRYSCRAFLPDQISDDVITDIVTAAQQVPSWCNAQPWQVIVTRGEETDKLRDLVYRLAQEEPTNPDITYPLQYTGVYKDRRRTCGWQLYDAVGVKKGDRDASLRQSLENFKFFGAPHVAVITTEADLGPYGVLDCGAFVTAFTLAATAAGLASIPQAALARHSAHLRAHFDIPSSRHIVCVISFGYEDALHPANAFRTQRADLSEVLVLK